jgi:hypothetical protein
MTYSLNPIGDTTQFFEIIDDVDSKLPIIGTGSPQGVVAAALSGQMYMDSASQETWVCVSTDNTINGTVWIKQTGELPQASKDQAGIVQQASDLEVSSSADISKFVSPIQIKNNYLRRDLNLSDVASATTSRFNLGCGTMATQNSGSVTISGGYIDNTFIGINSPTLGAFTNLTIIDTISSTTKSLEFWDVTLDLSNNPVLTQKWSFSLAPDNGKLGFYRYVSGNFQDIAAEFDPTTGSLNAYDSIVAYDKSGQIPITTVVTSGTQSSLRFTYQQSAPMPFPYFPTWEARLGTDSTILQYKSGDDLAQILDANPQARGYLSLERNGSQADSQFAAGSVSGLKMFNGQDISSPTLISDQYHSFFLGGNGQENSGFLTDTKTTSILSTAGARATKITKDVAAYSSNTDVNTNFQIEFATDSSFYNQIRIEIEGQSLTGTPWTATIMGCNTPTTWDTGVNKSAVSSDGRVPFDSVTFGYISDSPNVLFVRLNNFVASRPVFVVKRVTFSSNPTNIIRGNVSIRVGTSGTTQFTMAVGASRDTYTYVTANAPLVSGARYVIMSETPITMTLPLSPQKGDSLSIMNAVSSKADSITGGGTNCTLQGNGQPIMGFNEDMLLDMAFFGVKFVYIDSIYGWRVNYE